MNSCLVLHFLGRGCGLQRAPADGSTSRVWRICFRIRHPSGGGGAYSTHLRCKFAKLFNYKSVSEIPLFDTVTCLHCFPALAGDMYLLCVMIGLLDCLCLLLLAS